MRPLFGAFFYCIFLLFSHAYGAEPPFFIHREGESKGPLKPRSRSDVQDFRAQLIQRLQPGSTTFVNSKGGIAIALPGKDYKLFWKVNTAEFGAYRKLAEETKGLITVGHAAQTYRMFDMALDHGGGGISRGMPEIDIAVLVDNSGSMMRAVDGVVSSLKKLEEKIATLQQEGRRVRIALISFPADETGYAAKIHRPFSYSIDAFGNEAKKVFDDTGSMDETPYDALLLAMDRLTWRPNAARRIILITDEPPMEKTYHSHRDLSQVIRRLKAGERPPVVYPILVNQNVDE